MRPHLPEEELHAYADGALSAAQQAEIAQHMLACLICRAASAEVDALRSRASELLSHATPPVRARAMPAHPIARPARRRLPVAAAAALVLAGATSYAAWAPNAPGDATAVPRLATAMVASPILARPVARLRGAGDSLIDAPLASEPRLVRTTALASRAAMAPRVVTPLMPVTSVSGRRLRAVDPMVQVEPPAEGWQSTTWAEARAATRGAVAHLAGLPVSAVRMQETVAGGRPTAMVRQQLRDGRAVWVIEGTEAELEGVARLLSASGLSLSTPRRARPDYIGTEEAPQRVIRLVAVASYLPIDSLNALVADRLRLE